MHDDKAEPIKWRSQAEAFARLALDDVETHYEINVRQLYAIGRICEQWRGLRREYASGGRRTVEKRCRRFLEEILKQLRVIENLMVERADHLDPTAVDKPFWTKRMTIEEHSFFTAMNGFSLGEVAWSKLKFPSAYCAVEEIVGHIHNRLELSLQDYSGRNLEELNTAETQDRLDLEWLTKDFPKWYRIDFSLLEARMALERARAVQFILSRGNVAPTQNISVDEPVDLASTADDFVARLSEIRHGPKGAADFHRISADIIEWIFFPALRRRAIERKLNRGRKRVDIVFTNVAEKGFFSDLQTRHRVFCPFVFIECKNMAGDPANEDLDQLAGRFSDKRGNFGLLICRRVGDRRTVDDRCRDARNENRGAIIVLDDADITSLIRLRKDNQRVDDLLEDRYCELIM